MSDGGKGPDLHLVGGGQGTVEPDGPTAWETREAWLEAGRQLGRRIERDRWALGDWACHGERAYGDLAAAAVEIGVAAKTLSNLASVARKIETSRRREVLSWDHHAAVASLPADAGDALLDRAEAEGWSRRVMREEAQAASELERLKAENARLRRDVATANRHARDETRRLRVRFESARRVVRDEVRRVAAMAEASADKEDLSELHGNARRGLARSLRDEADRLAADVNAALARLEKAASTIEGAPVEGTAPAEAASGGTSP